MKLFTEVRSWFSPASLNRLIGPAKFSVEKEARKYLLQGGHRWRPILTAAAWWAIRDNSYLFDETKRLAVAVECFHKASLIHDDIEDGDQYRDDRKTLWFRIGVPLAINVGDFMIHEGYRMISETEACPLETAIKCQRAMCDGQHLDILGAAESWERIALGKTSSGFIMAIGFGPLSVSEMDLAVIFAEHLGIAYQAKDDGVGYSTTKILAALDQIQNTRLQTALRDVATEMLKS